MVTKYWVQFENKEYGPFQFKDRADWIYLMLKEFGTEVFK